MLPAPSSACGDDEVVASYVGTIGMAHGLGTLITAAGLLRLRAPDVRILIVGDGAELAALRDLASRQGLSNVMFTGLVPHEKVPGILAASDIALVTLKPCRRLQDRPSIQDVRSDGGREANRAGRRGRSAGSARAGRCGHRRSTWQRGGDGRGDRVPGLRPSDSAL